MSEITIPTPALVIPGFDELPEPIQAVIDRLSTPFPLEEVKVRPGAVKRDGTAALCLPYSDWWTGYLPRLNDEIGPNNWRITLRPWGDHQIIARLSAFGGLIVSESSGNAKGDANGAQEAEVQAKKRACAEGLMLGLYYYFLPKVWGKGQRVGKDFYFAQGEERRCVYEMYVRAGLIKRSTSTVERPCSVPAERREPRAAPSSSATPAPAARPTPIGQCAAAARAVLETAVRSAGMRAHNRAAPDGRNDTNGNTNAAALASDKQLGLIVALINGLRVDGDKPSDEEATRAIDAVGARFGITGLADLRKKEQLRSQATRLSMLNASKLIDALKGLEPPIAQVP